MSLRDAETRRGYLDRSFQGDPGGLQRMEELLGMAGDSAMFFMEGKRQRAELAEDILSDLPDEDHLEFANTADAEGLGEIIDGYKLIRRLGEGGCGIVYEAELERVNRRVALKIIRLGMDSEAVVARFAAERLALEMMDHPNIAKVQDAGTTPAGRPYFVLELVRGERITTWCQQEKLDIPARLRLFIQVCQAIQHAHQKGIIHRDIKPSNVLVTSHDGVPVPKVIDFG
ncbi:MAG: serine/threonine protein kinase, partial [Verrucomicrobiaceae bacterium]